MQLGKKKTDPKDNTKEVKHRQVNKCTMTDILFITLINYIREKGTGGFIALSEDDVFTDRLTVYDSKNKLLVDSGFISPAMNRAIYLEDNTKNLTKKFVSVNEYNYCNNLFYKTLKFIKESDYGMYTTTFKLYDSNTRKAVTISDFYDKSLIGSIKKQLFDDLGLYSSDWLGYMQLINNKDTKKETLKYTRELIKTYFTENTNENKENFIKRYGINYDTIYPAYIICIFDCNKNNTDIDNYIASKVKKLNFDKLNYIEQRSRKGTYKSTYSNILKKDITKLNDMDEELYKLIQNETYEEEVQTLLYKWYKLSIFDKYKKTNYVNSKQQQKLINKTLKEKRNEEIKQLKADGKTQKETANILHISERTVRTYWNK